MKHAGPEVHLLNRFTTSVCQGCELPAVYVSYATYLRTGIACTLQARGSSHIVLYADSHAFS